MTETYLTADQIYAQYPDQWVLLDRPKSDRYQNLLGGYVIVASADRAVIEAHLVSLPETHEHLGTIHTGTRPFKAVGDRPVGWIILGLLVLSVWATAQVTWRVTTRSEVRLFHRHAEKLEAHAESVRRGELQPDQDPNGIVRYPLPDELRRTGMVCIVRDGIIWYHLPSQPLDAVSPSLVTPLDRSESPSRLPSRVREWTYEFRTLRGTWAFWLVHSG
jgi:hypothetical protein